MHFPGQRASTTTRWCGNFQIILLININAYHTNLTIRNSSLRAMIWIRRKYVNWLPFSKTITFIELLEGSDCQYEIHNLYDWCRRHSKAKDLVSNVKEKEQSLTKSTKW